MADTPTFEFTTRRVSIAPSGEIQGIASFRTGFDMARDGVDDKGNLNTAGLIWKISSRTDVAAITNPQELYNKMAEIAGQQSPPISKADFNNTMLNTPGFAEEIARNYSAVRTSIGLPTAEISGFNLQNLARHSINEQIPQRPVMPDAHEISAYPPGTTGLPGIHGNTVYIGPDGRPYDSARSIQPSALDNPPPAAVATPDPYLAALDTQATAMHTAAANGTAPQSQATATAQTTPAQPTAPVKPAGTSFSQATYEAALAQAAQKPVYTKEDVPTLNPETTKVLQEALKRAGEQCGKHGPKGDGVDGKCGPDTKTKIAKMCNEAGVDPKLLAGPATPEALAAMEKLNAHIGGKILERQREQDLAQAKPIEAAREARTAEVLGEMSTPKTPKVAASNGTAAGRG